MLKIKRSLAIVLIGPTITTLLLNGCASAPTTNPAQNPQPYRSHCLAPYSGKASGIFRGAGSGHSLPEARRHAYSDIAEQLSVVVRSNSEALTHKRGTRVTSEWRERIESFSTATLSELQLDCLDKNDPSGQIHLSLIYDARPLAQRYGDKIIEALGYQPRILKIAGPTALTSSQLIQDLRKVVEHPLGQGEASSDISLNRTDNGWRLSIAQQLIPLSDQQLPYAINWRSLRRRQLDFYPQRLSGQRLPLQVRSATEYRWQITANNPGYLHLVGLYQNGQVDILRQDIDVRRAIPLTIPENDGVWEAGLIAPGTPTTDSYIALVTSAPLTETPLGFLLSRGQLGTDGSLNRFLQVIEELDAAVGVVNLAVLP